MPFSFYITTTKYIKNSVGFCCLMNNRKKKKKRGAIKIKTNAHRFFLSKSMALLTLKGCISVLFLFSFDSYSFVIECCWHKCQTAVLSIILETLNMRKPNRKAYFASLDRAFREGKIDHISLNGSSMKKKEEKRGHKLQKQ